MVLKPSSCMRQMTVAKSAVRLVLPAHRPAVIVADVSNPNLHPRMAEAAGVRQGIRNLCTSPRHRR